jgi:prepilin-type N-terminal cleavage/methylation domain-containing protein
LPTEVGTTNKEPFLLKRLSRSGFTVLELLIVTGVLSVLLAIILPTIKTVRAATLRNRAQAEATVLAQAAIRYKTEYGFWPGQLMPNTAGGTSAVKLRDDFKNRTDIPVIISRPYEKTFTVTSSSSAQPVYLDENEVYQSFSRLSKPSGGTVAFDPNPLNPKGLLFLDLEAEGDMNRVSFLDPWGRNYILFMGLNPNSTFTHTVTAGSTTYSIAVKNAIAFAFSFGPDGKNSTNYLYSAGVK